jgi:prepilin-type N-terminal cleavage/methylation domain-containing protein
MKKGFTLVELSIVLVIIGLLVGGVLVGQSLIESVKMQSFVRQFQQLDAAVASFKSKFQSIPGDAAYAYPRRTFGASAIHATKDGIITDDDRAMNTFHMLATGVDEPQLFWLELATLSSFAPDNCKDLAKRIPGTSLEGPRTKGADCNVGQAEIGNNAAIIPYAFDTKSSMPYTDNTSGNAYYMLDCTAVTNHFIDRNCIAAFTHIQALAFDAKTDDGIVGTGDVIAGTKVANGAIRVNGGITIPAAYDSNSTNLLVIVRKFGVH